MTFMLISTNFRPGKTSTKIKLGRFKTESADVGVTSGQKSSTKIIYTVLQTSEGLF